MTANNILITGCSSGIGRATAIHFARQQWQVFATVRQQEDADALMMTGYTNIHVLMLDVDDESQIKQLTRLLNKQLKHTGLQVLINNAAMCESAPVEFASTEHMQNHFSTNVIAPMVLVRSLLPLLKRANGRVINLSSGVATMSAPLMGFYSATKAALDSLSDALRVEVKGSDVKVIVVEPGMVDSPMHSKYEKSLKSLQQTMPDNALDYYREAFKRQQQLIRQLLKTAIKPEKVALAIHKAAIDKRPKLRYQVGTDAKTYHWLQALLPSPAKDHLWTRILGF
ncbi:Serine 3-dehydrogenase [BD1-7 clade bacterium]|uniref:Serine 3-dehydrogenase n=1 Tax=BD1-7 clade bacterium TaxID=2029982 RepID=A0A5S9PCV0_9GAMM|nr:Serine 3-dehydrogenase [BD1-7 clade bacterium]